MKVMGTGVRVLLSGLTLSLSLSWVETLSWWWKRPTPPPGQRSHRVDKLPLRGDKCWWEVFLSKNTELCHHSHRHHQQHHHTNDQVRTASERFLAALENRWQGERSVLMPPLADILLEHTRSRE